MSNEKTMVFLGYIRKLFPTHLCGGYFINHERRQIRIPVKQAGFYGKYQFFLVAQMAFTGG